MSWYVVFYDKITGVTVKGMEAGPYETSTQAAEALPGLKIDHGKFRTFIRERPGEVVAAPVSSQPAVVVKPKRSKKP